MIVKETLENGYIKTYSDQGYEIKNIVNGDTFLEAIDNPEWGNEYEEVILAESGDTNSENETTGE